MECFIVYAKDLEGRIDPYHYKQEFNELNKLIKQLNIKKLGEIAKFQYGINETSKEKGDIVYVRITDIDENGMLKINNLSYIDYTSKYKDYKLKKGDVLIARIGATFGKSYYFDEDFDAVFAGYLIRIILHSEEINSKYLFYFLHTKYFWQQANMLVKGTAQPQFNSNTIKDLLIPILNKQTQLNIIQIMDEAYHLKKQKEAEGQQLLNSIDHYILSELDIKMPQLIDKTHNIVYSINSNYLASNRWDPFYYQAKFEGVEKAIENGKYETKKIGEILTINDKLEDISKYSQIKYVDLASIRKDIGLVEKIKIFYPTEAPSRARQKLEYGDLLLSGLNGSLTSIAVFDKKENNYIASTGFFIIKKSDEYNNIYLLALFRSLPYQLLLSREASGAIMSSINRDSLSNIRIPLPPIEIQNKIAEEVKNRIQQVEKLQKEAKEALENAKKDIEMLILDG